MVAHFIPTKPFCQTFSNTLQATDEDLLAVFEAMGTVDSASIIFDRYSGRSKGFGFVEMPNYEEAIKAIVELDGKELWGRPLKVNLARPRV